MAKKNPSEKVQHVTRKQAAEFIEAVRDMLSESTHDVPAESLIRALENIGVKPLTECTGEAHSNAFIDHCGVCMPRWGRCGTVVKVR